MCSSQKKKQGSNISSRNWQKDRQKALSSMKKGPLFRHMLYFVSMSCLIIKIDHNFQI